MSELLQECSNAFKVEHYNILDFFKISRRYVEGFDKFWNLKDFPLWTIWEFWTFLSFDWKFRSKNLLVYIQNYNRNAISLSVQDLSLSQIQNPPPTVWHRFVQCITFTVTNTLNTLIYEKTTMKIKYSAWRIKLTKLIQSNRIHYFNQVFPFLNNRARSLEKICIK